MSKNLRLFTYLLLSIVTAPLFADHNGNHKVVISAMQPVVDIHDKGPNSAEAVRLRLLEFAEAGNEGGAFLHYNGDENRFFFGTIKNGVNTNTMVIDRSSNNVGIGTRNLDTGNFRLMVNGAIRAKEIVVETDWADYVFEEGYYLAPLSEVSDHIKRYGHLPNIPSAHEVANQGIAVGEMQAKLLAKIEELTLHIIALESRLTAVEGDD